MAKLHEILAVDANLKGQAQKCRKEMDIDAKLIVMGMIANEFTIADPTDAGQLDIVGFDASVPSIISQFIGVEDAAGSEAEE